MYRNPQTCSHLTNEHSSLLDISQFKNKPHCSKCGNQGPNLWICLHRKCMQIGCSDQLSDHSTTHFESDNHASYQLQHCIHLNLSSQRAWCFLCEREISLGGGGNRRRPAYVGEVLPTTKADSGNSQADLSNNIINSARSRFSSDENCDAMDSDNDLHCNDTVGTGLVGLQNIANTCYMNSALQALSNIWPMTHYFLNCSDLLDHALEQSTNRHKSNGLAKSYQRLICDMWRKRGPMVKGYITPRGILYGIRGVHPMFRGFQQHDTQEFLRCFMDQLHEELKEQVIQLPGQRPLKSAASSSSLTSTTPAPAPPAAAASTLKATTNSSMMMVNGQNMDDDAVLEMSSCSSSASNEETEGEFLTCDSSLSEPLSICDEMSYDSQHRQQQQQHTSQSYSESISPNRTLIKSASSSPQRKSSITPMNKSNNSIPNNTNYYNINTNSSATVIQSIALTTTSHSNTTHTSSTLQQATAITTTISSSLTSSTLTVTATHSIISDIFDGKLLSSVQCLTCDRITTREETFQDLSLPIPNRDFLNVLHQTNSLSLQSLNSIESTTIGSSTLSRSSIALAACNSSNTGSGSGSPSVNSSPSTTTSQTNDSWLQWIWNLIRSWIWGPSITIYDCMASFFSADELKGDNMYSCEKCNKLRTGIKYSRILDLPEVLCIHLKRFRHDLSYSTKISSYVEFPLEGFDMRPYLHKDCNSEISMYNLSSVICHHGTVGSGHYTCYARNTFTDRWYEYDDHNVHEVHSDTVQNCQAYVLFYHKYNPKMELLRFEANEVSSMNPLSQSEIRFFISRDWLARFNTFGEPGPINNWSILCPHGGVLQTKISLMSQLAVPISQSLWEFLHQKFGGGPVINMLFECETCKRVAENLARRQSYEHSIFTRYNGPERENYNRGTIYAVSMTWLRKWQQFARGLTSKEPGPINNTNIVSTTQNNSMNSNNINIMDDEMIIVVGDHENAAIGVQKKKFATPIRNVRIGSDYAQLCAPLWKFLHGIYGGGPEVILRPALDEEIEIIDQDELHSIQSQYEQQYVENDSTINEDNVTNISDTESQIVQSLYQRESSSNNENDDNEKENENRKREIIPLAPSPSVLSFDHLSIVDSTEKDQQKQSQHPLISHQKLGYCSTNENQRNESLNSGDGDSLKKKPTENVLPQIIRYKHYHNRNQHYRLHHHYHLQFHQQRHAQSQSQPLHQQHASHLENTRRTVRNKVLSKSIRKKMKRMRHDLRHPEMFGVKGNYSSVNGEMELQQQHSKLHDKDYHYDNGVENTDNDDETTDYDEENHKSNCIQQEHLLNDNGLTTKNAFNDIQFNNNYNEFNRKIIQPLNDADGDVNHVIKDEKLSLTEGNVTNIIINPSEDRVMMNGDSGYHRYHKIHHYLAENENDDHTNNNENINYKYGQSDSKNDEEIKVDEDVIDENRDAADECPQLPLAIDTKDKWCHHQLITTNRKHHRIVKTKPLLILKKYQQIFDEPMNDSSLETDV